MHPQLKFGISLIKQSEMEKRGLWLRSVKKSDYNREGMQQQTNSRHGTLPKLGVEAEEVSFVLEFAVATGACSDGFPLRVNELIAHLHNFKVNSKSKKRDREREKRIWYRMHKRSR